jgi:predicted ester cyclase
MSGKEHSMPHATRRAIVAAAFAAPLAAAASNGLAQEATPAPDDIEAIVRAFYEPFNTGDTTVYDTILAEDWADVPLGPGQQPGRSGFVAIIDMFRGIFPDMQVTNDEVLVDGNRAAVRSTIRGTHQGNLFGVLPATGKPVEFMAIDIHRVENGQIVETHHVEDFLSVLFQLGAVIQPGMALEATPPA